MIKLRAYPSLPHAWRAAAYLREHGVLARGLDVEIRSTVSNPLTGRRFYEHWLAVAFPHDAGPAAQLLDEFDALPAPEERDWSDQAEPDLALLPVNLVVPCERCRFDLRSRIVGARAVRCLRCGQDNDPAARVVAVHGPEALLDCYPQADDPDWIDDDALALLRVPCPRCAYALRGLPAVGGCPECGSAYDKRAMIERSFMDIRG